jgi:prepilin-type N-terminal cleavage/methylation domain-containing protein
MNPEKKINRAGFTLVEIMIVIFIIGVLATIAINILLPLQERARTDTIKSDLNSAYKAALAFHTDHPDETVTMAELTGNGFVRSDGIVINIVNGDMETLDITASHPGVRIPYGVDATGKITQR